MTTQAQIEAAREAIARHLAASGHTFADGESACWGPSTLYPHEIAEAALTAAAQVGSAYSADALAQRCAKDEIEIDRLKTELAATIERCAQVAEEPFHADGREIAAAIRKLKD